MQSIILSSSKSLKKLLKESYGKITMERAEAIISDRYSVNQDRQLEPTEPTEGEDYPIMMCRPDWVMAEEIEFYKSDTRGKLQVKSGNVSSYVATPATGDIWWAVGIPPAGITSGYTHLNLHEELAKGRETASGAPSP